MGILNLLLKRCHGNTFSESYYFSLLSTEKGQNFVVKENIYLPEIYRICEVHGPCNGLLCLQVTDDKVALWNPSTREIKFLPQPTIQPPPPHDDIEFFSIHTSFSPIGFGFDSNSEDYKVATFVDHCFRDEEGRSFLDCRSQVHLYSLKSDSWKEIPHPNERTFVSDSNHELLLFDPTTRETKNLDIHDHPEVMRLIAYVESLVPLNGTSELEEHIVR
ncbi:hypothetical protein PTKIN_Ptkin14bG0205500 [Pterospermum kingtungense]